MQIHIHFTKSPIVIPPTRWPSREVGACLEFQGIVREQENGEVLAGLFYEAYEPMARRSLERHLKELAGLYPCVAILFTHRLGWVPVGESSLFIRIMSPHRSEALAMMEEAINCLKQDVPIWKQIRPHDPD